MSFECENDSASSVLELKWYDRFLTMLDKNNNYGYRILRSVPQDYEFIFRGSEIKQGAD